MSRLKSPDLLKQINIIHRAYFRQTEESIKSYFIKCGIIGDLPPIQVLNRLFHDGVYPTKKFRDLHEKQLDAYITWKFNGKKTIKDVFGEDFSHLFSQKR